MVLLAPQLEIGAVQVLPERAPVDAVGGVDAFLGNRAIQRVAKLIDEPRRGRPDVEPHVNREEVLFPQPGEQARFQQRGLAEPRLAKQHGHRGIDDAAQQVLGLAAAAVEIFARALVERLETRPGILPIERRSFRWQ